ncbi:hypothetical protein AGMMS50293_24920 [Spirochaetia bacterium]|nr:hypothetical protein AGMMS50293_24920 [Spirochaetia bacterium]
MNTFNRKTPAARMPLAVLITAAVFMAFLGSCENVIAPDTDPRYPSAIAKVDYSNTKKAVFIDFSSDDIVAELPLDFFDIAIDGNGNIIANSGSYGSGVLVLKTDETDIAANLSARANDVKEYTFKTGTPLYGYQTAANPFDGEIGAGGLMGTGSGKVFIIKTATEYYKVIFDVFGMKSMTPPTPGYRITVVKGLDGGDGEKTEIEDGITGITNGYGYIYFDLDANPPRALNDGNNLKAGVTLAIPKITDWDLLCTRTNELQSADGINIESQMPVASRSSILLNTHKSVEVWTAADKSMDKVLNIEGLTSSIEIDAIGYGWYSTAGMPPTFSVNTNTYVVKTAEGNYAKFQPGTFYGPENQSFYMSFRYYYVEDDTGTFDQ